MSQRESKVPACTWPATETRLGRDAVTVYIHHPDAARVDAAWPTGRGHRGQAVLTVPAGVDPAQVDALAQSLTDLSAALWRVYTDPAEAPNVDDAERERRHEHRAAVDTAPDLVRRPHTPDEAGTLLVEYNPVAEGAHRVGRAVGRLGEVALAEEVANEVAAECDAVGRAELGDLTGRAVQAVALDRADASPAQVERAHELFADSVLGSEGLLTEVEPAAACVAAAYWLAAAAEAVEAQAGCPAARVVMEADNISALPVESPTMVLEAVVGQDRVPREVVHKAIAAARRAAAGEIPDLEALLAQVEQAHQRAADIAQVTAEDLLPGRTTPLDPTRPARDLLEDLLEGLRGCWLLFDEEVAGELAGPEGETDDAAWEREMARQSQQLFDERVRATATRNDRQRL